MDQAHERDFWNEVIANIGDGYRPHSAEYGVFLFREKLRRRGFREEEAPKLDPKTFARAVPWALFMTIGTEEHLTLAFYGLRRGKFTGLPREAFSCFDKHFQLCLGRVIPEGRETVDEVVLLTRVSVDRLVQLEQGRIDLYDAFRHSEPGQVLRIKNAVAVATVVRSEDLDDLELPSKGERIPRSKPLC